MSTKYTNPITITAARKLVVQQPSDDRGEFTNISDVTASIVADDHYNWFEYMLSYIHEIHQVCAWLCISRLPANVTLSDMITNTSATYPNGYPDNQYANLTFAFFSLKAVPTAHSHAESDIINLDKYTQAQVNNLLAAKQNNLPSNTTGSIAFLTKNAADNTFSWVVFSGISAPTNTGDTYGYQGSNWVIIKPNDSHEAVQGASYSVMYQPKLIVLAAGTHNLADPLTLPDGFRVIIIHDNVSNSPVELIGFQVENYTVPLIIPQFYSISLLVKDGKWRRTDRYT